MKEMYLDRVLEYDKKPTQTEVKTIKRIYGHELQHNIGLIAKDNEGKMYVVVEYKEVEATIMQDPYKEGKWIVLVHGVVLAQEQKDETDTKTEKQK